MRAPKNEATGSSGETEVLAQFERLGWAGLIDGRHDTGTDLYLRPRDARRYELGAMMGSQIKAGPSWFNSPKKNADGEITGWWFAEGNRDHFDYWLRHALPHVIILRDQESDRSYWAHVTPESVISTGKGAKILVPACQIVDAEHNEALSDIALTQLPIPTWDGSAWTGAVHLSPADEIRHALITPRLIAPHPNLAPPSISGLEALAMQVLIREELERTLSPNPLFATAGGEQSKWQGLPLEKARESPEWRWRATAVLHLWFYQGETNGLSSLVEHASTPTERAAATVLYCVYLFEQNDPDASLEALNDALQHDDYSPTDHAWLEAQRARALLEIGRHEEAFDLAMKTQRIYREMPSDVTAAAIAGACAQISFKATGWMQGDIASIIQRSDNPASWWRTQILSQGLSAHLSEHFITWSEDPSLRIGGADLAHRRLLSAALVASSAADQNGWRAATSSLAEHFLVTSDSQTKAESVARSLTLMRLSGDSKRTRQATQHVVSNGPTLAARIAARGIELSRSTKTTALADIELLTAAGDTLEESHADEICYWALETLQDPQSYRQRVRPTFLVTDKLIELLQPLTWALSESALRSIVDYCLDLPPVTSLGTAQSLARLIRAIPDEAWSEADRHRAAARTANDDAYLRETYLALSAPVIVESRETILERARAGDLRILHAVTDVRILPSDAVEVLIAQLCENIQTLIEKAATGQYAINEVDYGHALAMLNVWHPSNARWDGVEALLTDPNARPYQQAGALEVLAIHGTVLPATAKAQLLIPISVLRRRKLMESIFEIDDDDGRNAASEAFAALSDAETRSQVVSELIAEDPSHRAASARILERFGADADSGLLLALAGDTSEKVRQAALSGLSRLVTAEKAPQQALPLLSRALEQSGRRSAAAIVSRLDGNAAVPGVSELLSIALQHPSAAIRKTAQQKGNY